MKKSFKREHPILNVFSSGPSVLISRVVNGRLHYKLLCHHKTSDLLEVRKERVTD